MNAVEKLQEYVRGTRKVPLVRGDDALALARPGEFIVTGKGDNARIPHPANGHVAKAGEVFELGEAELRHYAAWIKIGAIVPEEYYRAYQVYMTRQAYIDGTLNPAAAKYSQALQEVNRSELLIVASRAQLAQAEQRLARAQLERDELLAQLADALDGSPQSS